MHRNALNCTASPAFPIICVALCSNDQVSKAVAQTMSLLYRCACVLSKTIIISFTPTRFKNVRKGDHLALAQLGARPIHSTSLFHHLVNNNRARDQLVGLIVRE